MNCNLPKITYPRLRTLLLVTICEAITPKTDVEAGNFSIDDPDFEQKLSGLQPFSQKSVLKKVKNQTSLALYRSSIGLQLGAESMQIREKITSQVVHFFQSLQSNLASADIESILLRDLTISTTNIGLVEFEFGEWAIAHWLQAVLQACLAEPDFNSAFSANRVPSENPQVFFCQYCYARCSALLRLTSPSILIGQTVELWLTDKKLQLGQERSLIMQIIETLDEWEDETPLKSAIALSETFLHFYQTCQIVKHDTIDPQIAHCRLALVMITHWLLKQLLERGLGVFAPETL
ncbi:DALR anticodon-binding domain-containing protein [Leptolyngbya sp. AN03gr2]|uniref:DALR anticodon-binding domain-containing protein n=1 Tax=Leptolyngbya sp. AN03gr2 TaxID=3423364 RepID=UPI003D3141A0